MTAELDWWSAYPLPEVSQDRAHVRMNFVSSADGAVTLDGRSGGLGGPNDRALMRVLRTLCDVVLVGAGTVRAEGYGGLNLPDALLNRREESGLHRFPRIAIVSGSLDLEPEMSVFTKAEVRPLVITHAAAPESKREALAAVADVLVCGTDKVGLGAAAEELAGLGLGRVLCEGGPTLFGALLEADLVDEVCLSISPQFVAGSAPRIAHSDGSHPRGFSVESVLTDEESFVFLRYARS
ncbi:MAG: pyrimidine reductase family protein [Leucobacter sp.]